MKRIRFVRVTSKNLGQAIALAREIFPYEIHNGIFLPEAEYRLSLETQRADLQEFFMVKYGGRFAGITGYYFHYRQHKDDELWLGYFGLREEFRGNGIGKKMLKKTLNMMKKFNDNLKTVKLYTSNREQERGSHFLYRCVGFRVYAHYNTQPFQTYYLKKRV